MQPAETQHDKTSGAASRPGSFSFAARWFSDFVSPCALTPLTTMEWSLMTLPGQIQQVGANNTEAEEDGKTAVAPKSEDEP